MVRLRWIETFLVSILTLCMASPIQPQSRLICSEALERSGNGVKVMMEMYNQTNGLWGDNTTDFLNWWNSANVVHVIAEYVGQLPNELPTYKRVFENTFFKAQQYALNEKKDWKALQTLRDTLPVPAIRNGFTRMYFDDDGWWAMAWISVYDVTQDESYLDAATMIFEHMAAAWTPKCGGGVWWNTDYEYKNAIANELFMFVSASLANRVAPHRRAYYRSWAIREYTWFFNSGMMTDDYTINDGLDTETCGNNQEAVWSYNQGVIIGALIELDRFMQDPGLLDLANRIAKAGMRHLSDRDNILHDICEPNCWMDGDSPQFKGIFIRNLRRLDRASPNPRYKQYILTNAQSVWANNQNRHGEFGDVWSGPPTTITASTHSSALDVIVAAIDSQGCAMN